MNVLMYIYINMYPFENMVKRHLDNFNNYISYK